MPVAPVRPPMLQPGSAEENFPEEVPALEELLAALDEDERIWNAYIKELSGLENPASGACYAAELHQARQYRMVIKYRKEFCKSRLNRLKSLH